MRQQIEALHQAAYVFDLPEQCQTLFAEQLCLIMIALDDSQYGRIVSNMRRRGSSSCSVCFSKLLSSSEAMQSRIDPSSSLSRNVPQTTSAASRVQPPTKTERCPKSRCSRASRSW